MYDSLIVYVMEYNGLTAIFAITSLRDSVLKGGPENQMLNWAIKTQTDRFIDRYFCTNSKQLI